MVAGSFFTLLILSCVIPVTIQQNCCPVDYSLHIVSDTQAICIRKFTTSMTFEGALASCEMTQGASLLKLHPFGDVQAVIDDNSVYWIGLRRDPNDGVFRWTSDSTRLTSGRLDNTQPSAGLDCVRVNTDLTWEAVMCSSSQNYTCQVEVNCQEPTCKSTVTEARCPCEAGFVKDGSQCQDINECVELSRPCNIADNNVVCGNTWGSYNCQCNAGFSRESPTSLCTENQDCTVDTDCTGNNQECRISYDNVRRCQCLSGYAGAMCDDINECNCSADFAQCFEVCENGQCEMRKCAGDNEVCMNNESSFTCNCRSGFERNERNFCVDIDECATTCSGSRQTCTNTVGSFQCVCDSGYELQNSVCVASCLGRCNNFTEDCQPSDFSCVCKNGYVRNAVTGNCQDVDECGNSDQCSSFSSNAACSNTPGSFICQCATGFQRINDECVDINECADDATHTCQSTAECINTQGSFTCACGDNERFQNGNCIPLRSFRVKIVATELNNTVPGDASTSESLFRDHFCKVIMDNLESEFPGIPENCNSIRFVQDASSIGRVVTAYLQVMMASSSLSASTIESRLAENVVQDISGDMRIRSGDTFTTITIANPASGIDVAEFSTDPCNPSPCLNDGSCTPDLEVIESTCRCALGFSGDFCEIVVATQQPTTTVTAVNTTGGIDTRVIIIIGIGATVLLLLLVLCFGVCCCFLCLNRPNTYGAPVHAPGFVGPTVAGRGVAPIRDPPSVSGYGRGGYYEANSVI